MHQKSLRQIPLPLTLNETLYSIHPLLFYPQEQNSNWYHAYYTQIFTGYLSDSPHEFFVKLLEFVTSWVEQGEQPMTVLQSSLPNLFGPAFGIKNHAVSCKLLEYGYLAVCSQHR